MKTSSLEFTLSTCVLSLLLVLCGCGGSGKNQSPGDAGSDGAPIDGRPVCVPGAIGCPCSTGKCTTGECIADLCKDCVRGEEGCTCRSNGSCGGGLRCNAAGTLCETCPPGEKGCNCLVGNTCSGSLVCTSGVCTEVTCAPGTTGCPCRANSPACDTNLQCGTDSVCRACATDVPGCACIAGACTGGLICAAEKCRKPLICADLVASKACDENALCRESTAGADADCLLGFCKPGYRFDPVTTACIACTAADPCPSADPCDSATKGGKWEECQAQFRECVVDATGISSCGKCIASAKEDANMKCVPEISCGGKSCTSDEYCLRNRTDGSEACVKMPCNPPQVADATGICLQSCSLDCTAPGHTGRVWPFLAAGACVCETRPGYFIQPGGTNDAVLCDADKDGWVKSEAGHALFDDPAYEAYWQNRRCNILSVDNIELVDEYGIAKRIDSCSTGLEAHAAGCVTTMPLRLLEPERNDVQALLDIAGDAPVWGERRPYARELNALTKGCHRATSYANYDANKDDDLSQTQNLVDVTSEKARLQSFAYFMELYSSFYRPPTTGASTAGTLVIAERSRCGTKFPLHYVDKDAPSSTITNQNYWRNCQRLTDTRYLPDAAGFDFAQWSSGVRAAPAWVTAPSWLADPGTRVGALPQYGLCALNGAPPSDGKWRGLNHHSQFKCIQYEKPDPSFSVYNTCKIKDTEPVTIAAGAAVEPSFDCSVTALPQVGQVVWGIVKYIPYGAVGQTQGGTTIAHPTGVVPADKELAVYPANGVSSPYVSGCVNEDMEWGAMLCPDALTPMRPADGTFGRVSCAGKFGGYVWAEYTESVDALDYSAQLLWDYGRWE